MNTNTNTNTNPATTTTAKAPIYQVGDFVLAKTTYTHEGITYDLFSKEVVTAVEGNLVYIFLPRAINTGHIFWAYDGSSTKHKGCAIRPYLPELHDSLVDVTKYRPITEQKVSGGWA
jgi:hypothetical protein